MKKITRKKSKKSMMMVNTKKEKKLKIQSTRMKTKRQGTTLTTAKDQVARADAHGEVQILEDHVEEALERVAGGAGEGGTEREKGRVVSRSKSKTWGRGQ